LIEKWLNENLMKARAFKQPQLWICSDPNLGKTTLMRSLERYFRIYWMPKFDKWFDRYDDDAYDLLVLDEFKGQLPLQMLNEWLDGSTFQVPRRSAPPYEKRKNLPMIVCSNWDPYGCYNNCTEDNIKPLCARVEVVRVFKFLEFEFKACNGSEK